MTPANACPCYRPRKPTPGKHPARRWLTRSEKNFEYLADSPTDIVVAVGREGKRSAKIEALTHPLTAAIAAMAAKLQTGEGQSAHRRRKWLAEPLSGWAKSVLSFRQFSLRGLHRVQAEFKLVCLALNLGRMGAVRAV